MSMQRIWYRIAMLFFSVTSIFGWTESIYKKVTIASSTNESIICASDRTSPFTQLVFSWNSLRPERGYFSFWVRARDAKNGKWGSWHRIIDWGSDVQKSYATTSDGIAKHVHVRFEAEPSIRLQGFQIKAKAHSGAQLSLIKGCAVSLSDFEQMVTEKDVDVASLSSVKIAHVPFKSQFLLEHPDGDRICSPTSLAMVMEYMTKQTVDVHAFAKNVYDHGLQAYGSWPFNTAQAFHDTNGELWFFVTRLASFKHLHDFLKNNVPVVVSIRGPIAGSARPYLGGHLLVVIGFDADKKEVICRDPAFDSLDNYETRYPVSDFLVAWERSRRLAYIAERNNQNERS